MPDTRFNGYLYDSEEDRNSVAFHSYASQKRIIETKKDKGTIFFLILLGGILGLLTSSWIVFFILLMFAFVQDYYFKGKKLKLLKQYSDMHYEMLIDIEERYRTSQGKNRLKKLLKIQHKDLCS